MRETIIRLYDQKVIGVSEVGIGIESDNLVTLLAFTGIPAIAPPSSSPSIGRWMTD